MSFCTSPLRFLIIFQPFSTLSGTLACGTTREYPSGTTLHTLRWLLPASARCGFPLHWSRNTTRNDCRSSAVPSWSGAYTPSFLYFLKSVDIFHYTKGLAHIIRNIGLRAFCSALGMLHGSNPHGFCWPCWPTLVQWIISLSPLDRIFHDHCSIMSTEYRPGETNDS